MTVVLVHGNPETAAVWDHFVGDDAMRRRAAARAGARVGELDGLGHWWMCQDPVRGAALLTDFWRDVAG